MKVILIEGCRNTGKTTLCEAIDKWLATNGYSRKNNGYCLKGAPDFYRTYEGIYGGVDTSLKDKEVKIVVNSASDLYKSIKEFEKYYADKSPIDILITTIRSSGCNIEYNKDVRQQIIDLYTPSATSIDTINLDTNRPNTKANESFCDFIDRMLKTEFLTKF